MKYATLFCLAALSFFPTSVFGQAGTSSTSVGVARAGFYHVGRRGQFLMPQPEMIRVEEFINYHRHDLPLPKKGKRVRLDVQNLKLENGKTVFQLGLTTPRAIESKDLPPLNIVLVVDESGSMSGSKIQYLKQALHAFVERFRKTDKITIVGFEQEARVILESVEKTKIHEITRAIDCIHAQGSTNLHAGLMCGYRMALKHFDEARTNRVIFLTDGNANVGVTESADIARESKNCIKRGISLVTIGLGVDFNHGLLRELADSGRGVMHYVGDAQDIKKTFVDEIDSVLAPAARKVKLTISFAGDSAKPKFYGYRSEKEHSQDKGKKGDKRDHKSEYVFRLDDLSHGATQVVIAKLPKTNSKITGSATLTYVDAVTSEKVSTTIKLDSKPKKRDVNQRSIKRNYAIALVAEAIRSAAEASNNGDNKQAEKRLAKGIEKAKGICSKPGDKNVNRVLKIAKDYCNMLARN
jgi:Mg-chelatase subunit ChlD